MSKRILSLDITLAMYFVLVAFFAVIAITFEQLPWKLFSVGIVFCALIAIPIRILVLKKLSSDVSLRKLKFWDDVISVVPMGVVFYSGAIYSLINPGTFLAFHTCVILLVMPIFAIYWVFFKSK